MRTDDKESKNKTTRGRRGGRQPGSGRPKGSKNKRTLEIEAAAKVHAGNAIKALASILRSRRSNDMCKIAAANALLDRGYGRPRQALEHTGRDGQPIETKEITGQVRQRFANRIAGLATRMVAKKKEDTVVIAAIKPTTNGTKGNGTHG